VRNRLPEAQAPEAANRAFDRSTDELTDLCKGMSHPTWFSNAAEAKTSIEAFPEKVQ
jgi:hypothetical protein